MNDEIIKEILETQKLQTKTIKELFEIWRLLKDRVEGIEEEVKKINSHKRYLPVGESKDLPVIRIDGEGIHNIDIIGEINEIK